MKNIRKAHIIPKVIRTAAGLRDALFDELDRLRNGESNPQNATAVAKLACQIVNSVKAEVEYSSHVRALPNPENGPLKYTLPLGTL